MLADPARSRPGGDDPVSLLAGQPQQPGAVRGQQQLRYRRAWGNDRAMRPHERAVDVDLLAAQRRAEDPQVLGGVGTGPLPAAAVAALHQRLVARADPQRHPPDRGGRRERLTGEDQRVAWIDRRHRGAEVDAPVADRGDQRQRVPAAALADPCPREAQSRRLIHRRDDLRQRPELVDPHPDAHACQPSATGGEQQRPTTLCNDQFR